MPTIPDNRSISRVNPSGQSRVAVADPSLAGDGLRVLGGTIADISDTRIRHQTVKAENEFLRYKEEQDRSYDDDKDFETIEQRYREAMSKKLEDLSGTIADPVARQLFKDSQLVTLERGITGAVGLARNKEIDYEKAYLNESLADARQRAARSASPEDFETNVANAELLVESNAALNNLSEMEREELVRGFRNDTAVAYLNTLDPSESLEMLGSNFADYLPEDTRVQLIRDFKVKQIDTHAIALSDEILEAAPSIDAIPEMLRAIDDPDLREATEQRTYLEYGRRKTKEDQENTEMYNDLHGVVTDLENPQSLNDIIREDPSLWDRLTPSQRDSLRAAELNRVAGNNVSTDQSLQDELYAREVVGDYQGIWDLINNKNDSRSISAQDRDEWSKIAAQRFEEDELKAPSASQMNRVDDMAQIAGINNDTDRTRIRQQVRQWYYDQQQRTGKVPDDKAVDQAIMTSLQQIDPDKTFGSDDSGRVFEEKSGSDFAEVYALRERFIEENGREPDEEELSNEIRNQQEFRATELFMSRYGRLPTQEQLDKLMKEINRAR